jgi:uncharacterized protein (DUF2342 family)
MRRAFRRGIALGAASGLAAVLLVEATRPRGGTAVLLDWDEVTRIARARLREERTDASRLSQAAARYNRFAAELRAPLLETVGGTAGTALPPFEALDRAGWLDLNVQIMRRVLEPLTGLRETPRSWLTDVGRSGLDRYVAAVLEYLGRRVLGQFDPQLLARESRREALYLVEPNVEDWERRADLDGDDLRRWLILHELTHAWQFGAHPPAVHRRPARGAAVPGERAPRPSALDCHRRPGTARRHAPDAGDHVARRGLRQPRHERARP